MKLFKDEEEEDSVTYSEIHQLDLSTITPCVSGPKRSLDKIALADLKTEFRKSLTNESGYSVKYIYHIIQIYFPKETY